MNATLPDILLAAIVGALVLGIATVFVISGCKLLWIFIRSITPRDWL